MILLGSTGSIGVNALSIASKFDIKIEALVAGLNYKLLNKQIHKHKPKLVAVANKQIKQKVLAEHKYLDGNIFVGEGGILELIQNSNSNLVLNGLVGFLGLSSSALSLKLGKKLALANKESLVVAGKFIDISNIIPVDSEHFSLKSLLHNNNQKIKQLFICASGGAFRGKSLKKLKNVSIQDALNHPNWSMGDKITIDSATMCNKLFELLEARWLFNTKKVDAFIEPKSIMHAMVSFNDGTSVAHLSNPDMKIPIVYAMSERIDVSLHDKKELKKYHKKMQIVKNINLCKLQKLEFKKIKKSRYPIWQIKNDFIKNDNLGVVLNAANEIAVDKFLKGSISFLDIAKINIKSINRFHNIKLQNIDDVFLADLEIRKYAQSLKV